MKSKKLNLNELKVKSFVTEFDGEKQNTAKGGLPIPYIPYTIGTCSTRDPQDCPPRDSNQSDCGPCPLSVQICMSNGAGGVGENC
ncbi:MAG: pinensin family lanthipeptide [Cyclobacteriaceae bacterium]